MKIQKAMQCHAENGQIGDFGYIGDFPTNYKRITPIFTDYVLLLDYLNETIITLWESNNKKWSIQIIKGQYCITDGWFCDFPIKYDHNGLIAYDHPEIIPKYVKNQICKFI